jgi:Zn-dependent peptidase ImmA (M78 family)
MVGIVLPKSRVSIYRPAGQPLRQHFLNWNTATWYSKKLQRALEIVEQIHGDGFWQKVRLLEEDAPQEDWSAGFKAYKDRAYLFFNQDQSADVFEVLHEFGHGVLAYGFEDFDNTKIATDPIFAAWRTVIVSFG